MPPYYSVLNFGLMEKLVTHLRNPNSPAAKVLTVSKIFSFISSVCYYIHFKLYPDGCFNINQQMLCTFENSSRTMNLSIKSENFSTIGFLPFGKKI